MQENENLEIDETENETETNMTHVVRCMDGGKKEIKNYFRKKAIKIMCTECMGFEYQYVRECTDKNCPLYPFRGPTFANRYSIEPAKSNQNKNNGKTSKE